MSGTNNSGKPRTRRDGKPDTDGKPNTDVLTKIHEDIQSMKSDISEIKDRSKINDARLTDIEMDILERLKTLEEKVDTYKVENEHLKLQLERTEVKYKNLLDKCVAIESQSRRCNLLFDGIPESQNENCELKIKQVLQNKMNIEGVNNFRIVRCHRLGRRRRNPRYKKPRTVIIKFHWFGDREEVWSKRKRLAGTNVYMSEDFPKEIVDQRRTLLPIMKAARAKNKKASLSVSKLVIEGRVYTVDTLHLLPPELDPHTITTLRNDDAVAFCNELSPLSNFYSCKVTLDGGVYQSCEQAFQYRKAMHCGDEVAAHRILASTTPLDCKKVGDAVQTEHTDWEGIQIQEMEQCVRAKFMQSKNLQDFLKNTGSRRLGEATNNKFWGIGMTLQDENVLRTTFWTTHNHLGCILEQLRAELADA